MKHSQSLVPVIFLAGTLVGGTAFADYVPFASNQAWTGSARLSIPLLPQSEAITLLASQSQGLGTRAPVGNPGGGLQVVDFGPDGSVAAPGNGPALGNEFVGYEVPSYVALPPDVAASLTPPSPLEAPGGVIGSGYSPPVRADGTSGEIPLVPLPPAAFMGLAALGLLGLHRASSKMRGR